ncbi:MAG: response regulator [Deltaproteobacteria bacterium]|jgi:response regulator RpfG family c-di-GMP phosphodiesterase|nr:response regulator [Deltaproteobacteria bacterium]
MEKILFVDDEQNVLDALDRQLRRKYNLRTAISGEAGLEMIAREGPFAVVVSDMRMPLMDGIMFLKEVRRLAPQTVRLMLTGNAERQTAIDAINQGAIFRFLTKPSPVEEIVPALNAALEQYRLITAEKELLEKTLKGSIKILVDILSLANPVAFSQAMRIRKYVASIARRLSLPSPWQYEVAALLASLGFVNIPPEIIEKHLSGTALTDQEKEMIASVPQTSGMLLANIPRLATVAAMITQQNNSCKSPLVFDGTENTEIIRTGANLLRVLTDFDTLLHRYDPAEAIRIMAGRPDHYDPSLLDLLTTLDLPRRNRIVRRVKISELRNGMIIDEDVYNAKRIMVVPRGYEVNDMTCERLKNFLSSQLESGTVRILQQEYSEEN